MVKIIINSPFIRSFNSLDTLNTLFLSSNRIKLLPDELFLPMKNLSRIHLDYNQLEFLPKDFSLMTQLKKLTITNNQIHAIDWWSFQKLNFQQLQVAKNPFDCSCNNYELRSWSEIFMNPKETQDRIINEPDRPFRLISST